MGRAHHVSHRRYEHTSLLSLATSGLQGIRVRRSEFVLLAAILMSPRPVLPQEVNWLGSYGEGAQIAGETNRPMLVDFWSKWCIPCVKADKEVFTNPEFVVVAGRFVLIRVNTDSDPATAARFGVRSLPARLLLDPQGKVLREISGQVDSGDLVRFMESIPGVFKPPPVIQAAAAPGDAGPAPVLPVKPPEVIPGKIPSTVLVPGGGTYVPPASVVDLPVDELRRQYPEELKDVTFGENQDELVPLLRAVGQGVDGFLANLPNTVSKEWIRRERLSAVGRSLEHVDQDVEYLLILRIENGRMDWEEARTDRKGRPVRLRRFRTESFLTSGFALESVMLATSQQSTSRFRYLGRQASAPFAHLIAFVQKPETTIPGLFRVNEFTANLLSQGIAWIDPASRQVIRIRTDLLEPLTLAGLTQMTTQISYEEHRFSSSTHAFWLPREVVVTFRYRSRDYRNTHRYSDYRLFSVESYEKTEPVRRAPEP